MSSKKVSYISHWVVRNPHLLCNLGKTRPFNSTHWHLKKEILLILALGSLLLFPTGILKRISWEIFDWKKDGARWLVCYVFVHFLCFIRIWWCGEQCCVLIGGKKCLSGRYSWGFKTQCIFWFIFFSFDVVYLVMWNVFEVFMGFLNTVQCE